MKNIVIDSADFVNFNEKFSVAISEISKLQDDFFSYMIFKHSVTLAIFSALTLLAYVFFKYVYIYEKNNQESQDYNGSALFLFILLAFSIISIVEMCDLAFMLFDVKMFYLTDVLGILSY